MVVLRSTGGAGYNSYLFGLGGLNSVQTLLVDTAAEGNDACVAQTIREAGALFIAGGNQAAHRKFKRPPKPDDQTAASQDGTSAAVRSWLRRPFGPSRRFPWGSSGLDLRSRS
jgi:hypothetical protein